MYRSRLFNVISSSVVFIFIFSQYNDNFLVSLLGSNSLKIIFLVFILFNFFQIVRNVVDWQLMSSIVPFFIFFFLNFFTMIINPPVGEERMSRLFENVMLLVSMLFIVLYFINYDHRKTLYFIWITLFGSSIVAFFNEPITQWTFRKTGGTGDPNEFASQIISFLFISIFLYLENKNIFFLIISVVAFLYSILFAGSMSSFLVLGIIGILVLIRYLKLSFTKSMIFTVVAITTVVVSLLVFQEELEKVEVINNILGRTENTATANTRLNSWNAGLRMISEKPILGVGMGEYPAYSPKYSKVYLTEDSVASHNLFLELIAESGVIVFFAFIFFLFTLLNKYFRTIVHSNHFWIYVAVVGYLFMGLTLGIAYEKYFWITIAVLMNIQWELTMKREESEQDVFEYSAFKGI